MKDKLISVIVPIYNVENYLDKCISSIIQQTYKNLEIILVDDGSKDTSGDICERYKQKDSRIVVVHQINQGLVAARKTGLNVATGDYIGFVDGDDYVESVMYEKLLQELCKNDTDIVHSGWIEQGIHKVDSQFIVEGANKLEIIKKCVLDCESISFLAPSIWSKLFKADVIRKCYSVVPVYQSYGEDWLCLIEAICKGYKISSISKAYYHYVIRSESVSHLVNAGNYEKELNLYLEIIKILKRHNIYEQLKIEVDEFIKNGMVDMLKKNTLTPQAYQKFFVPNIRQFVGMKVVLYGAGRVGLDYYSHLSKYQDIQIVGWLDERYEKIKYDFCRVQAVRNIENMEYDYVIIANKREKSCDKICKNLLSLSVPPEKIVRFF